MRRRSPRVAETARLLAFLPVVRKAVTGDVVGMMFSSWVCGRAGVRAVSQSAERGWLPVAFAVAAVAWGANQFSPLLLVYRDELGLSASTVQATFGLYALGLVPGLLLGGPASDVRGRRPIVLAALAASVLASGLLLVGGQGVGWLFAGRLIAGIASGAAFSAGAAWIKERSDRDGPRRATVAMTAGFAAGPLVAGLVAQWAPARTVVPYLPHLALTLAATVSVLATRGSTRAPGGARRTGGAWREPRFRRVIAPLAPWVFGAAAIPLAYLPGLVSDRLGGNVLVFGAVIATLTALAGIAVQPLAAQLSARGPRRLLAGSLGIVVAGMLIAAMAAATTQPILVVGAALVLGAGYGCCQVCGLGEVQRLASPDRLAGMTAAYQCLSYLGFALPFVLAAVASTVSPPAGLLVLATLAALTLLATFTEEPT
jgi:MFS family permease